MDWWNELTSWLTDAETRPVLLTAAVLFVAVLIGALIVGAIVSRGIKRQVRQRERGERAAAVATLVDASVEAAAWSALDQSEQALVDRAIARADLHVRMLPLRGTQLAADWSSHQLSDLKRNSATYGTDLGPVVAEFRDRLVEWQQRPGRAKRIFESDLQRWRFNGDDQATGGTWSHASSSSAQTQQATPAPAAPAHDGDRTARIDVADAEDTTPTRRSPAVGDPTPVDRSSRPDAGWADAEDTASTTTTGAAAQKDDPHRLIDDVAALEDRMPQREDDDRPQPL